MELNTCCFIVRHDVLNVESIRFYSGGQRVMYDLWKCSGYQGEASKKSDVISLSRWTSLKVAYESFRDVVHFLSEFLRRTSKLSSNVFQYKCFIRHFSPSTYFFNIYLRNPCNFSFFLNRFLFVVTIIVLYIWYDSSILRYTIFNHQKSVLSLKLFQSIRAFILLVLFHWKLKCYTHRSSQNV